MANMILTALAGAGLALMGEAGLSRAAEPHWSYVGAFGPEHWAGLSDAYAKCAGKMQSPVDIPANAASSRLELTSFFEATPVRSEDIGHAIKVTFMQGQSTEVEGLTYGLQHALVRTPSEHLTEGVQYPMSIQFFHESASGEAMVLSVMVQAGKFNAELETVIRSLKSYTPVAVGDPLIDARALIPDDLMAYRYPGSQTMPPCDENVMWNVATQPIEASAAQIRAFQAKLGYNARPVQPLNGREVLVP